MGRTAPPMIETTVDGRYQIIARIASGGMGEVYRALDPVLGREVAIKVLHTSLADDPGFIDRFRREARSSASLSHPNIVAIHDWGETGGTYFMVMEYVRGPNLRALLLRDGALEPMHAAEIVTGVLGALEHAHRQGIVHRDVKPENVMLTTDGAVKVADFGLARALADARISHAPGTVTGTVQYLAPEQIEGQPSDPRTDLYSTGIVLYELLTGTVPFTGETSVAIAYKHLRERVPPPSRSNPMVPASLDSVVLAATERNRANRTPDAGAMRAQVEGAKAELPPAAPLPDLASSVSPADEIPPDRLATVTIPRPLSPKARRRQRLRRFWTVLSILVILAAAGWAVWTYVIPHRTRVPDLEGLRLAAAQRAAAKASLGVVVVDERYSSTVPVNRVISQTLQPGAVVEEGSDVRLVLSLGPELVSVPEVEGKPLEQARDLIKEARLEIGAIRRAYHEQVPEGRVIEQNPVAGTQLEVGEKVGIVVSRGEEPVSVPSVIGLDEDAAASIILDAGLQVSVVEEFSVEVAEGEVISQNPSAGARVPDGTTVTIVVSKGPQKFPMPDVVGMTEGAASDLLEGKGLVVKVVQLPGSTGNQVVHTNPRAGETVKAGDQVTIYVR
jgi:beta-lactam-binding protein with PASTA domain